LPSSTRNRQPGRIMPPSTAAATGARRSALPRTKARRMAGSVRLTLSYSAASVTGSVAIVRAAACSDGRRPRDTSVTSSTTVENSSSREYWRSRCSSNTASIHPAGNACSNAVRAITLAGACCSNRSITEVQMAPLLPTRQIRTRHLGPAQRP